MDQINIEEVRALVSNIKHGDLSGAQYCTEMLKKVRAFTESPEVYREYLNFKARFYNYSLYNSFLIYLQNHDSTFVGSFAYFKKLGYSVKKNQHGMTIMLPVEVNMIKVGEDIKKLSKATEDEKIRVAKGELQVIKKTYFKPGTVFDISQTTVPEEDLPKILGQMKEKPECRQYLMHLFELVLIHGIRVNVRNLNSISLSGYYDPDRDEITLNKRLNDAESLTTLTHEFGHALLHKNSPRGDTAKIEFEAESVAYLTLQQMSVNVEDYSFRYIHQYFSQMEDQEVETSLKRIDNTARYIIGQINEKVKKDMEKADEPEDVPTEEGNILKFKNRKKGLSSEETIND